MSRRSMLPFSVLVLVAVMCPTPGAAQAAGRSLAPLAWLTGCWEQRVGTRVVEEQWMAPAGGLMLGVNRTTIRGEAREFEFLRIELRDTTPTYLAQPGGRPPTAFAATALSDSLVTFANPAHDFPQRISDRRAGADSIVARVEATREGQVRGLDFPMVRVPCGR